MSADPSDLCTSLTRCQSRHTYRAIVIGPDGKCAACEAQDRVNTLLGLLPGVEEVSPDRAAVINAVLDSLEEHGTELVEREWAKAARAARKPAEGLTLDQAVTLYGKRGAA